MNLSPEDLADYESSSLTPFNFIESPIMQLDEEEEINTQMKRNKNKKNDSFSHK